MQCISPSPTRCSYREQFLERIKEANPGGGDNNETVESINLAADSSSEKRDMQLRLDQSNLELLSLKFKISFGATLCLIL